MILDATDLAAYNGEPTIDEQGSRAIRCHCCADTFAVSHLDGVVCITCTECDEDIALLAVPDRDSTFASNGHSA